MTCAPQWRAKSFPDLPPVCHDDAAALSYYQRNWGIAQAVLGTKAPARLQAGVKRLLAMGKTADTRTELYNFLKAEAPGTAHEIFALTGIDPTQRQYLTEMILGVDIRIAVELEHKEDKDIPGRWKPAVEAQYPFAGWMQGGTHAEREAWRKDPPLTMEGSVEIVDQSGKPFLGLEPFKFEKDCGTQVWHTRELTATAEGPDKGPIPLVARVRYKVGDMAISYDRPIIAGGEEPGNGEKGRKLLGDRIVRVTGRLLRDLGGWNAAFTLPSGQYIAAATQGNSIRVFRGSNQSVAPEDGTIPAGTSCDFGFSSGWQPWEARLSDIRVLNSLETAPAKIEADGAALDISSLSDFNRSTSQKASFPSGNDAPLTITTNLPTDAKVRGVDLRLKKTDGLRMTVEAERNGQWQLVFQGRPADRLSVFQPVNTRRLRVSLTRLDDKVKDIEIEELRIIRAGT